MKRRGKTAIESAAARPCMNEGCPRSGYLVTFSRSDGSNMRNVVRLYLCERCETIISEASRSVCTECGCDPATVCADCAKPYCVRCGLDVKPAAIECPTCSKALDETEREAST